MSDCLWLKLQRRAWGILQACDRECDPLEGRVGIRQRGRSILGRRDGPSKALPQEGANQNGACGAGHVGLVVPGEEIFVSIPRAMGIHGRA